MLKKNPLLDTLIKLGVLSLTGIHAINRYIASKAVSSPILKSDQGSFYDWSFGKVFYNRYGEGDESILLIHDVRSYSSSVEWENLIPRLQNRFTVYVLDLPGCGLSDKPQILYTNYLYVQLLTSFVKDIIRDKTYIAAVGLSFSFAVMAAHSAPELFRGLYAVNPISLKQLHRVPDYRSRILCRFLQMPVLGTCVYHFLTNRKNIEYLLNENYFYNPFLVKNRYVLSYYQAAHMHSSKGRFLRASLDGHYLYWNIDRALAGMKLPVTLIFGEKLPYAREISRGYMKLIPRVSCKWIPKTKMLPHLEAPEVTDTCI